MTEEYIKKLLDDRKIAMSVIHTARKIVYETDAEIISALSMQAVCCDKDTVQTSGTCDGLINIISRLPEERRQARYNKSVLNAVLDAQESEIEWLDGEVFRLPKLLQRAVLLVYYDRKTQEAAAIETNVHPNTIQNYLDRSITIIAKNTCGRLWVDK